MQILRIKSFALFCLAALMLLFPMADAFSQAPRSWSSARIYHEMEKLSSTTSVLYIAAHPDDENTRLITWLANEKKVRTGYLSLTRGDGGQNLIGSEQGAHLGVIRTQELMAARRLDGGEQFFTRAVDFGYSKTAEETFTKWEYDSLLSDVVWVIRNFRPDIIITRFPPDARAGHGHHTASAMLAEEAFSAAADPERFPRQLSYADTWQAQRLYWNNSLRWDPKLADKIAAGESGVLQIDVGAYAPLLGKSLGEIAAESRTNHKSQGFGSTPLRGEQMEYLALSRSVAEGKTLFDGIETRWTKWERGADIDAAIQTLLKNYDLLHPERSIPALLELSDMIATLQDDPMITYKKKQLDQIIAACLGLYLEAAVSAEQVTAGTSADIYYSAIIRTDYPVTLQTVHASGNTLQVNAALGFNKPLVDTLTCMIPADATSNPFWLQEDYENLFYLNETSDIGRAENAPALSVTFSMLVHGHILEFQSGVIYKETDAVKGEIIQPVQIVPMAFVKPGEEILLFTDDKAATCRVTLQSNVPELTGYLFMLGDAGISVSEGFQISGLQAEQVADYTFKVSMTPGTQGGVLRACFIPGNGKRMVDSVLQSGSTWDLLKLVEQTGIYRYPVHINYDHIPAQMILEHAEVKATRIATPVPQQKILYVEGAGDAVYESLRALGCMITTVHAAEITPELLQQADVVILGVRLYNTEKAIVEKQPLLMKFVEEGGTLIAQYSTNWDSYMDQTGPFPYKLTRNRIANEDAPVTFLIPEHRILNYPNILSPDDFKYWVQERGIYFAGESDSAYLRPLAFTDPKEDPQSGGLLIAEYGKGYYVYTGIVFFRQLPAAVPGAYRLMVNLISLKNNADGER